MRMLDPLMGRFHCPFCNGKDEHKRQCGYAPFGKKDLEKIEDRNKNLKRSAYKKLNDKKLKPIKDGRGRTVMIPAINEGKIEIDKKSEGDKK